MTQGLGALPKPLNVSLLSVFGAMSRAGNRLFLANGSKMGLSMEEFMSLFVPTGNEYEEYIKENGNVNAADVPLSFSYEGVMGGCGTRLLMDGKEGSLMYNSHGPTFDGFDQQRGVDLVSYDPSSGKLVLKVSDMYDKVTGKLVGTLKNNQYSGKFVSVNGKSSPFTFK